MNSTKSTSYGDCAADDVGQTASNRQKYDAWIRRYAEKHTNLYGWCISACAEMRAAFPELREVRGWGNEREHVWLVDPQGNVVDPTAGQFGGLLVEYRPWKPGNVVRVGRCMDCGEDIYARVDNLDDSKYHRSFCDDVCYRAFARSLV